MAVHSAIDRDLCRSLISIHKFHAQIEAFRPKEIQKCLVPRNRARCALSQHTLFCKLSGDMPVTPVCAHNVGVPVASNRCLYPDQPIADPFPRAQALGIKLVNWAVPDIRIKISLSTGKTDRILADEPTGLAVVKSGAVIIRVQIPGWKFRISIILTAMWRVNRGKVKSYSRLHPAVRNDTIFRPETALRPLRVWGA
jgi:hypothetical protein